MSPLINGLLHTCSFSCWEIDKNEFKKSRDNRNVQSLGVCSSHYSYDRAKMHPKKDKLIEKSLVYVRQCLFCYKYKCFCCQGQNCSDHSVCITRRNVQVPCSDTITKVCSVSKQERDIFMDFW